MIVWLASYPRSGNGFLRIVLRSLYGVSAVTEYSNDHYCLVDAEATGDSPLSAEKLLAELHSQPAPCFVKTHDLSKGNDFPAIYLVRDGRDALVSYAWYALVVHQGLDASEIEAKTFHDTIEWMIECRDTRFGTWSQNVLSWTGRPRTVVMRFESFIHSPAECVAAAIKHLDLELSPKPQATIPDFERLNRARPQIFRRGKVGSWRDEFPLDLLDLFWRRHGKVMQKMGYQRHGWRAA